MSTDNAEDNDQKNVSGEDLVDKIDPMEIFNAIGDALGAFQKAMVDHDNSIPEEAVERVQEKTPYDESDIIEKRIDTVRLIYNELKSMQIIEQDYSASKLTVPEGDKSNKHRDDDLNCIALDGGWGSGKTFIKDKLIEGLKADSPRSYVIVDYNAGENAFYNDPLIALLYCIYDAFLEFRKKADKAVKRQYRCKKRRKRRRLYRQWKKSQYRESWSNFIEKFSVGTPGFTLIDLIVNCLMIFIDTGKRILKNDRLRDYKSYKDLINDC